MATNTPLIDQIFPFSSGGTGVQSISAGPFNPKAINEWLLIVSNSSGGTVVSSPLTKIPGAPGTTAQGVLPTTAPYSAVISSVGGATIAGVGFSAFTACATPVIVNSASQSGSSVTTLAASLALSTVGNTIIAIYIGSTSGGMTGTPTWGSSLTNTVSKVTYNAGDASGRQYGVWMGAVAHTGTDTWTLTASDNLLAGSFIFVMEVSGLVQASSVIGAAQHLYEYESIALNERTIIATSADATGVLSSTNDVVYFDGSGVPQNILTPSATATNVRAVDSRDYMYFADGVAGDLKKWHIQHGTSLTGIVAPISNPVPGSATGGGSLQFGLASAANASGGNTVYTAAGGVNLSGLQNGTSVQIGGFTNAGNNGTFTVQSSTSGTVTVNNTGGVAETGGSYTLTTQNLLRPTTLLNGWGGNAHVGSYEGGVNQGFTFGLDPSATGAYSNPGNAFDGDPTTFASFTGQHAHLYAGCVWSFAGITSSATNVTLNVLSEVPSSGTDGQLVTLRSAGIWYSIDGGSTWTQVYNSSTFTKAYSQIAIPNGTTLSNVQVLAFTDAHDDMYHKVYDIYMQATFTGSGPITLQSGRVYFEAFANSVTGHISDVSPASVSTGAVFGGSIPIQLVSTSPDPQVDTEYVLATADGGDETTLYFLASLPIGTTTYLDTTPEEVLLQANTFASVDDSGTEHGIINSEPPPGNGQFPTKHRGRIYMLAQNVLFFSKSLADLTTSTGLIAGKYEEAWDPQDQFDVSEGAESGNGLYSDGVNLYIGTKRHIRRLQGDSPINFVPPDMIFNDVGLNNQEVWQGIYLEGTPAGSMWMTPDFRVLRSDFNTYNNVGEEIQTTLNTINKSASNACWATYVGEADQNFYVLAIPTGTNTVPDTLCVYNIARGKWFVWTSVVGFISGLYYMNFLGVPRFIVCSNSGSIFLFDPSQTKDNVSSTFGFTIPVTIQTSWISMGDPQMRKVLNEIEVGTGDKNMLVTIEGATTDAQFTTPNLVVANAPLTTNFLGEFKVMLAGFPTVDRYYRFTFVSAPSPCTGITVLDIMNYLSIESIPYNRY